MPEATTDEFLKNNPVIDFVVNKDGEIPFSKIVGKVLQQKKIEDIGREGIPGVHFYDRVSNSSFHFGAAEKVQSLDEVPSPYLNGMMQKFFTDSKYNFAPFIESNRGCPYACTFCHTAGKYYSKIQWAGLERLEREVEMFAKHYEGQHEVRLFLADNNFGMFDLDLKFADILRKIQEKYNWPRYIAANMGKARPDHIVKVNARLKWGMLTTASVQTLTESVLKNIERKNLKFDDYIMLTNETKKIGQSTMSEIILGLPGETRDSFMDTIRRLMEAGIQRIIPYTLMNLRGAPLYDFHMEKKDEHLFKYRIAPRQFGDVLGKKIFDVEEVIVGSPTFSYDDYLYIRGFSYVIRACYNESIFPELIKLMREYDVDIFQWLISIYSELQKGDCRASQQMEEFLQETEDELWESEEKLTDFFKIEENYQKLVAGKFGSNLLSKYLVSALSDGFPAWLDIAAKKAEDKLLERCPDGEKQSVKEMIQDIRIFGEATKNIHPPLFDPSFMSGYSKKHISLKYDIPNWRLIENVKLAECLENLEYFVFYDNEQIRNFRRFSKLETNDKNVKFAAIMDIGISDHWAQAKPLANSLV